MAGIIGNDIITDGLILALDAANTKSYPGSGTNYNDISGNGIVATLANSPTINSNGTITLDGINQYIQVVSDGTTAGFNVPYFTIDMWVNFTSDSTYDVLWSYDYSSHAYPYYSQNIRLESSGNALRFSTTNNISMLSYPPTYSKTGWQNITYILDSADDKIKIYVNGIYKQSSVVITTLAYYSQEVWIGRANFTTGYYKGDIGPYKFYNRPLSSAEILQNYNATKGRFI